MELNIDDILKQIGKYKSGNINVNSINLEELKNVLTAYDRSSALFIDELDADEVFVFGSNDMGLHRGRASKLAKEHFGAIDGKKEGLFGQSYALPVVHKETEDTTGTPRSIEEITKSVNTFIGKAKQEQDKTFLVTRVGCGFAGHTDEQIAPLFREALCLSNVRLPLSFLDVLLKEEETISDPSELAPTNSVPANEFPKALENSLNKYSSWIRKNYHGDMNNRYDLHLSDDIEKINFAIVKAVKLYFKGLPSEAYKSINDLFSSKKKETQDGQKPIEPSIETKKNDVFYRMRVETDNWERKNIGKEGLFHVPLSKRCHVKTQRYSIPGFPSLYLGEHIRGCWEEMGRPNLSNCLISRYENSKEFRYMDLTIRSSSDWFKSDGKQLKDASEISDLARIYPFVIACTFKTHNNKAIFKPEYIIPQIMLQFVKELAYKENQKKSDAERFVYGIKYSSVHMKDSGNSQYPDGTFANYVIPIIDIKHEHCSKLSGLFALTDPICEEFERSTPLEGTDIFESLEKKLKGMTAEHL